MANPFKGEASAHIDGATYTLRLDFNALCVFEDATGQNALEVLVQLDSGKATARSLRALVLAMLSGAHPDATPQLAGNILSQDMDILRRVTASGMPAAPEGAVGNGQGRGRPRPA